MFICYVAMTFIFSYNLKADLSSPHREDSNDTTLTFSNAVFRFPYTANNAVNTKFRVRGRVTSKGLRGLYRTAFLGTLRGFPCHPYPSVGTTFLY